MPDQTDPVTYLDSDSERKANVGVGLCLSGGGYRAMLFHLGSLLRLVEIGYIGTRIPADLGKLERISSVSGGSITSAQLGLEWARVEPAKVGARERFFEYVIDPIRRLAGKTIDVNSVLVGFLPGTSAAKRIAAAYRKHLFGKNTLSAFPDTPRFVVNATNLQSGVLWRFMKPYTRDWKVGEIPPDRREIQMAMAVAASSAFPPFLSPAKFRFSESDFTPKTGAGLQIPPYTTNPILSDGGVYDNLGLETVWKRCKTVLVSDAGGQMPPQGKVASNWPMQAYRVLNVIDNQVRSLRKRQVIDSYVNGTRTGAYWGIRSNIANYELPDALPCPFDETLKLANTPTRLKSLPRVLQERLVNWGYAVCDAAIRKHVDEHKTIDPPERFPYPESGVG